MPYLILKSARPRQWIKNFAVYAALIFSGFLFFDPIDGPPYFLTVSLAFLTFCLLTSSVYIINDLMDVTADRAHPFKKKRPIAAGDLSAKSATIAIIFLLGAVIVLSQWLSIFFKILVLAYFLLQFAYAKYLKHIPIMDVATIASGFLLRVYAGAVVVNLHMNVWFLLTVISLSMFLAVGKRQSERTLLSSIAQDSLGSTRKILKRYSQRLLDQFTAMFATATWLTYALFTFQNQLVVPESNLASLYTILPKTLHSQKLLMLSLPFVIFGVM